MTNGKGFVKNKNKTITSRRYFNPFWDVRFKQFGSQTQFGPHSKTTPFASIKLKNVILVSIRCMLRLLVY